MVDPGRDPLASGYQATQSRIAIGSGRAASERATMEGTQTQLRFLPTQHTDFAFSVVAEEWGFVGSTVVLIWSTSRMLFWGLVVARSSKDDLRRADRRGRGGVSVLARGAQRRHGAGSGTGDRRAAAASSPMGAPPWSISLVLRRVSSSTSPCAATSSRRRGARGPRA